MLPKHFPLKERLHLPETFPPRTKATCSKTFPCHILETFPPEYFHKYFTNYKKSVNELKFLPSLALSSWPLLSLASLFLVQVSICFVSGQIAPHTQSKDATLIIARDNEPTAEGQQKG